MRRVEHWHHTVKLYHYTDFMDTIDQIIESTSMDDISSIREITIPRLQRMRHRTYYIRNTQPELARGIKTLANCLIDLYSTPSLLSECHLITIKHISWRFNFILQHKKGEDRKKPTERPDNTGRRAKTTGTTHFHTTHQPPSQHVNN